MINAERRELLALGEGERTHLIFAHSSTFRFADASATMVLLGVGVRKVGNRSCHLLSVTVCATSSLVFACSLPYTMPYSVQHFFGLG